jgi:hypothetical protein
MLLDGIDVMYVRRPAAWAPPASPALLAAPTSPRP